MQNITIDTIDAESPYLNEVKNLWRKNSDTLGFFPEGAFDDHATKKSIMVALSSEKELMGYLLYRTVRSGAGWPKAVIVHLCVIDKHRRNGVARRLVDRLVDETKNTFLSIELKCRRDFQANKIWPNIGFTYNRDAKGRTNLPLIRWCMTFRELPLMALFRQRDMQKRFLAVIDSNILFRLQDEIPANSPAHEKALYEEAKALLEDWLCEDVTLAITDETFNEIHRQDDSSKRQSRLSYANKFHRIRSPQKTSQSIYSRLKIHFPEIHTDNLKSDLTQVSQTIAGDAYCFITQDNDLLKKTRAVEKEFKTKVMSPGEFVGHVDEIIREIQYRPILLGGSRRLAKSAIHGRLTPDFYAQFRNLVSSEKKSEFERKLRTFMAQPTRYQLELCSESTKNQLALIVYDRVDPNELIIPLIRIAYSPIAPTLLRYLLRQIVMTSFHEKRAITRITDTNLHRQFKEAFEELGFSEINGSWIKCNLAFVGYSKDLCAKLESYDNGEVLNNIREAITAAIRSQDPIALADIEHRLWPAKILDANIVNYIIPIKPTWAQHLFDEDAAAQTLWGAKEEIALRHENVYYRRYKYTTQVRSPARILWYVTKSQHQKNSMQLKACSSLDEVVTGRAKELFKQFQRLGIYEWNDIIRDTHNDPSHSLMALRFNNSEVFRHPVDLKSFLEIVKKEDGKSLCLQSPQTISAKSFSILYKKGMGIT